jgi:Xaa-Pro aminopeptidase
MEAKRVAVQIEQDTFRRRLAEFADQLMAGGFTAAIISQPADLYYLTGTAQPANLLVVPGGEPVLFARRFRALAEEQSAVGKIVDGASLAKIREALAEQGITGGKLGMELDVVPAKLYLKAVATFTGFEIADCSAALHEVRVIKDEGEVAALRRSAAAFAAVHEVLVERLAPGRTELEIAAEVERVLRRLGHEGMVAHRRWDGRLAPEGNLVSGKNLPIISGGPITISGVGLDRAYPMGASTRRIEAGDTVNIDLGINIGGYHGDIARSYVLGRPGPELEELAVKVRSLQDEIIAAVRPGRSAGEIYAAGVAAAEAHGVADVFQGYGGTHGPYVGHGLGLELDEPPVLGPGGRAVVKEGMVLAIEPKLISPHFGGVNLEDDVVVTADGVDVFEAVERSVFVCEGGSATAITP